MHLCRSSDDCRFPVRRWFHESEHQLSPPYGGTIPVYREHDAVGARFHGNHGYREEPSASVHASLNIAPSENNPLTVSHCQERPFPAETAVRRIVEPATGDRLSQGK